MSVGVDEPGSEDLVGRIDCLIRWPLVAPLRSDVDDFVVLGDDDAVAQVAVAAVLLSDDVRRRDDSPRHVVSSSTHA